MNVLQFMKRLNEICYFRSIEKKGELASNSEIQRWVNQGSVLFNGERVDHKELVDFPITSVVLFPSSPSKRCTLK